MAGWGRWHRAVRRGALFCIGLSLLSGAISTSLNGQEPPKPDQNSSLPAASAPTHSQQPGAGAQVRTGSQFAAQSVASRLARLLGDHQFSEIEKLLDAPEDDASGGTGKLTPEQKQLYRGVLANRENRPQESIHLLEPLVAKLKSGQPTPDEKLLRKTLAEDYLRSGDLAKANQAYLEFEYR